MSIASRIENMYGNVGKAYKNIEDLGIDLTNVDKNLENLSTKIEEIYEDLPKVTNEETDEDITLNNTRKGKMVLALKGQIQQDSTTGKNLFDIGTDLTNDYFITTSNGKYINTSISVSSRFTGDITNNSIVITNIVTTNYPWLSKFIKLEKNTQYTIQLQSSSALSPTPIICGANSDTQGTTGTQIGSLSNGVLTFNSGEYDYYWLAIYFGANSNTISNIQIEKGSTATEYEPYTNGASPNPDYPQDIHIVSGDNTIEICGKNLFDGETEVGAFNSNGAKTTGTNLINKNMIRVSPSTTYRISNNGSGMGVNILSYQSDKTYIGASQYQSYESFTTSSNTYYINFWRANNLDTIKIQLEQGNTISNYEAYQSNSQLISLGVENLFDKDNASILAAYIDTNIIDTSAKAKTTYIACKPNTTYTISKRNDGNNNRFTIATSNTTPALNVSVSQYNNNNSASTMTITTNSTANYLCLTFYHTDETTLTMQQVLDSIQIEKGSKANSYTPYGTTPIELCKIGNYQDYIYKEDDKWYLHKEIGKVVLNGSESWSSLGTTGSVYKYYTGNYSSQIQGLPQSTQALCSHFRWGGVSSNMTLAGWCIFNMSTGQTTANGNISFSIEGITTASDFETWLSTHNTIVNYVLATPTYTKIEGTLKDQLEAIKKSYDEQTNISQSNFDLPFKIKATALKEWETESPNLSTLNMSRPTTMTLETTPSETNEEPISLEEE